MFNSISSLWASCTTRCASVIGKIMPQWMVVPATVLCISSFFVLLFLSFPDAVISIPLIVFFVIVLYTMYGDPLHRVKSQGILSSIANNWYFGEVSIPLKEFKCIVFNDASSYGRNPDYFEFDELIKSKNYIFDNSTAVRYINTPFGSSLFIHGAVLRHIKLTPQLSEKIAKAVSERIPECPTIPTSHIASWMD